MVITITNADDSLIKIIETLNEKLAKPYKIIGSDETSQNKANYEFKTLEEWGLTKLTREVEKQFTAQEIEQIRQEVRKEMTESSDEL